MVLFYCMRCVFYTVLVSKCEKKTITHVHKVLQILTTSTCLEMFTSCYTLSVDSYTGLNFSVLHIENQINITVFENS